MRFLGPLALGLVSLLAVSRADAAPKASRSFILQIPANVKVHTPVEARAALVRQASIPAHVELAPARITKAGPLTIYRFPQVSHGMRVISRGAAIAVHPDGSVALATARVEPGLPASAAPGFDAKQAVAIAKTRSGLDTDPQKARLAVWPVMGGARLAYVVRDASLFPSVPYVPIFVIDAQSGRVLAQENAVKFKNLAKLHKFNPVSTPTLEDVELKVSDPNVTPDNDDLLSFNCIDTHALKPVNFQGFNVNLHVCELESKSSAPDGGTSPAEAYADPDGGDFLQYEKPADNAEADPFAELSIFHHASQAYDYFRDLSGDPEFKLSTAHKAWPLYLIANVMMPSGFSAFDINKMQDPSAPLEPLSNAMYTGWDPSGYGSMISAIAPEIQGAALAFGQGNKIDFSYDGDVVFHEFGHAVVDSTAELVGYWHLDSQGASVSPGSMNEALADFFSSAIAGDPNQGEYACKDIGTQTSCVAIRTLTNDKTCPQWLTGEVHSDSEFFSAAMWEVRAGLTTDADKKTFDLAVLTALNTVSSGDLGYEDLADAFVKALAQTSLGQTGADQLTAAFTSRGVLPKCVRQFSFQSGDKPLNSKDTTNLAGLFFGPSVADLGVGFSGDWAPGLFQVKVALPANTTAINFSMNEVTGTSSNPLASGAFKGAVLVSFGKPIEFDADMKANTDVVLDATSTKNTYGYAWKVTIPVQAGATEAYVMVVNKGDVSGSFRGLNFTFESSGADAGPDAEIPDGGPGDASEDAGPVQEEPPADDDGGCGCRAASPPASGAVGALLASLAAILVARRRR